MTHQQELLLPYVAAKVADILETKTNQKRKPCIATLPEISKDWNEDILQCMRQLILNNTYQGCNTLNNPALIPNKYDL